VLKLYHIVTGSLDFVHVTLRDKIQRQTHVIALPNKLFKGNIDE